MAKNAIKVGAFSATTAGTVSITPVGNPGIGGLGSNLFMEVTGISTGSALTTSGATFKWLSPGGGTSVTICTIGAALVTSTTNGQFLTFVSAFVDATKRVAPMPTHVSLTFQTVATSNGIACDLYLIPAD